LVNYIHLQNILTDEEYKNLQSIKESVVRRDTGAITIQEDGTITTDRRLKSTHTPLLHANDYIVSQESIFNNKKDIDSFQPYLGSQLITVMEETKVWLTNNNVVNPKPYMARCYRNNIITPWHKHSVPKGVKPSKFWVSIYYMHPNWDIKYRGEIKVGLTEKEIVLEANCLSNSMIIHNGFYGHGVEKLILGYEGDRDIFLTHWESE
jgi:hypothetical protein